jgi:hypothetical protein
LVAVEEVDRPLVLEVFVHEPQRVGRLLFSVVVDLTGLEIRTPLARRTSQVSRARHAASLDAEILVAGEQLVVPGEQSGHFTGPRQRFGRVLVQAESRRPDRFGSRRTLRRKDGAEVEVDLAASVGGGAGIRLGIEASARRDPGE